MKNMIVVGLMLCLVSSLVAGLPVFNDVGQEFDIEGISIEKKWYSAEGYLSEDTVLDIEIVVRNVGSKPGTQYVEAGFYERSLMRDWDYQPLSIVRDTETCVDGERYVTAKTVQLDAYEREVVMLEVRSPDIASLKEYDDYSLGVNTFYGCYADIGGGGSTDAVYRDVVIGDRLYDPDGDVCEDPDDHCNDGKRNCDETDTNCGGSCRPCAEGGVCSVHGDCESGTLCLDNRCAVKEDESDDEEDGDGPGDDDSPDTWYQSPLLLGLVIIGGILGLYIMILLIIGVGTWIGGKK